MPGLSTPPYKLPAITVKKLNPAEIVKMDSAILFSLGKDDPRRSPSLDQLTAQNEFEDVTKRWMKKHSLSRNMRIELDQQWQELRNAEHAFRDTIIAHNKFIRRNLDKRLRAIAKIEQQQELIRHRQSCINYLSVEVDKARILASEMRKQIRQLERYEEFLIRTIEHHDSVYKSINDLLNKFQILLDVRAMRQTKQSRESFNCLEAYHNSQEMIKSNNYVVLGLRNELNEKSCYFGELKRKTLLYETLVTSIISKGHEIGSDVVACYYLIDTIYRNICIRKKERPQVLSVKQYQLKLEYIKRTMIAWKMIRQRWSEQYERV